MTGTKRVASSAVTPGRRASSWRTLSSTGSAVQSEMSPRSAEVAAGVSTTTSIASRTKLPMMTIATAAATPTIARPVRSGRRSMLRTIMRSAGGIALDAEPLEQRRAVAAGRRRPHRLGGRQPHGGDDRVQRAERPPWRA